MTASNTSFSHEPGLDSRDRASESGAVAPVPTRSGTEVNPYLRTKVMTASPAELRLMLIEGGVRFAEDARVGLTERDYERAYEGFSKSQAIVMELIASLNPSVDAELCKQLGALYTYIYNRLVTGSMERDLDAVGEAIELLSYERDTWRMLMDALASENTDASDAPAGTTSVVPAKRTAAMPAATTQMAPSPLVGGSVRLSG